MKRYFDGNIPGFLDEETQTPTSVEISEDLFLKMLDGQAAGKRIVSGEGGFPELAEALPQTAEELAISERNWRDAQLNVSDNEVKKHEDDDPGAIATVAQWRAYRSRLRAWPDSEHFPESTHRPRAPYAS